MGAERLDLGSDRLCYVIWQGNGAIRGSCLERAGHHTDASYTDQLLLDPHSTLEGLDPIEGKAEELARAQSEAGTGKDGRPVPSRYSVGERGHLPGRHHLLDRR